MKITIRQETPVDNDAVYELVKSAFITAEHSDGDEHELVNRLRKSEAFIPELSLVAEHQGKITGYIMFTKIKVGADTLIALAPLAVIPGLQKQGIGSRLIEEGHKIASKLGYKGSIVLGHEKYYPKFGYKKAGMYGIFPSFEVPEDAFMAAELQKDSLKNVRGTAEYAPEFFEK